MLIQLNKVNKTYLNGEIETQALNDVDLQIDKGDFIVVYGPSGSGKSTLLNVLSGLDVPDSGSITIGQDVISAMNQQALTLFRRRYLGFIFQQYNLLSTLTVRENVELGHAISDDPFDIDALLEQVGIADQADKFPYQLSGGQQQRVSIARALVKKPWILFCDEPTGALDEKSGKDILTLLKHLNRTYQTTIMLITHNPAIALLADKVVKMNSGAIVEIKVNTDQKEVKDISWS
ncbi:MAG: ABC transporter ATP-binding protein [Acholeplasmataceae bacterium]|nr:MAG: ABC transporter ATP-binding protein [Acholeplasmataceae bacterium]